MPRSIHTEQYKALCTYLKDARKRAGLTQQQIAGKLQRPQSYVAKYERAERRLDVIEFLEVAEAVGFDPADAIRGITGQTTSKGTDTASGDATGSTEPGTQDAVSTHNTNSPTE